MQIQQNKRIDYIDLTKGFCILLVVYGHAACLTYLQNGILQNTTSSFRMPLYFFLSGLFFKLYDGLGDFVRRKINRLIVPFVFWHLALSIIFPVIMETIRSASFTLTPAYDNIRMIFHNDICYNVALWFLLCLFVTNVLFYVIYKLSLKVERFHIPILIALTVVCGFIGWLLRVYDISLPLYIDSALTSLPFFAGGFFVKKYTGLLYGKFTWKSWLALILCFVPFIPLYIQNEYCLDIRTNGFFMNTFVVYLCGFTGTLFVLLLSKLIVHIPIVSYFGRYSIIILVLHCPLIYALTPIVDSIFANCNVTARIWILFAIVSVICGLLIYPCRKYLPQFTAQRDIFRGKTKDK